MGETNVQGDGEHLLDTDDLETGGTPANDTDDTPEAEKPEGEGEGEQKQDLDLEVPEAEKPKEPEVKEPKTDKEKQIEAWAEKIKSGKAKLEDIPVSQAWLINDVKKSVYPDVPTTDEVTKVATDVAKQTVQSEREQLKFDAIKAELKRLPIKKDKLKTLSAEFKDLCLKGLRPLEAVETAMKIAGIDIETEYIEAKRKGMTLPKSTKASVKEGEIDPNASWGDVKKTVPEKKRLEHLKELSEK